MKNVRPMKTLLIILRDNVEEKLVTGLCRLSDTLWNDKIIDLHEMQRLRSFIKRHEPKKGRYKRTDLTYYWYPGQKNIRINWLNYQIRKTPLK
jgi:hypothetical protein